MDAIFFKKVALETFKATLFVYISKFAAPELLHQYIFEFCSSNFLNSLFCSEYDIAVGNLALYSLKCLIWIVIKVTYEIYKKQVIAFVKKLLNR